MISAHALYNIFVQLSGNYGNRMKNVFLLIVFLHKNGKFQVKYLTTLKKAIIK